jgi:hypothetical protein
MIPPIVHSACSSAGEREVFRRLASESGTDGWIVLHSLDIAKHRRQVSGEVDFVVIVPGLGVLCLEVKGCRSVRRHGGAWYYGTDGQPDYRGPFKQVSGAMHSLRSRVAERRPDLSRIPFWSAVLFTHSRFQADSGEWHEWQAIDSTRFRSSPMHLILVGVLKRARAHLSEGARTTWFIPESNEPYPEQCEVLAQLLRSDFEYFESPRSRHADMQAELKRYTDDQIQLLDSLETNQRLLIRGPAGTGKTVMAIESARRGAAAGRRVLFLCYNRLLCNWLGSEILTGDSALTCSTLHRYLMDLAGAEASEDDHFWDERLPEMATDALLDRVGDGHLYDEIVIDEAQDLLRSNYFDVLGLSLRGGLAGGRWRIFGDFENQAVYGHVTADLDLIRSRLGAPLELQLRTNCRNPPRIALLVHLLGGLTPEYWRILREDNGIEVVLRFYKNREAELDLLASALESLYAAGLRGNEIVVLSPRVEGSVASELMADPWRSRMMPFSRAGRNHVRYGSIRAFKGLESSAVVVTDLEHLGGQEAQALLYTGMTRALDRLVLIMHDSMRTRILTHLSEVGSSG